jgi:hypothetical protein
MVKQRERNGKGKPLPNAPRRRLIERWWVQVLVAMWVLAVVTVYFRLQLMRLLEVAGRQ